MTSELTNALKRICSWLAVNNNQELKCLNRGLSKTQIDDILGKFLSKIKIPSELYELYQWRNGSSYDEETERMGLVFDMWGFSPLKKVRLYGKLNDGAEFLFDNNLTSPMHVLNIKMTPYLSVFFGFPDEYTGRININQKGEIESIEFGDEYEDSYHRLNESVRVVPYYNNLTHMMLTLAEYYEQACYLDNNRKLIEERDRLPLIWHKYNYNSSRWSELTLEQLWRQVSFDYIHEFVTAIIAFDDPIIAQPLIKLLQSLVLNSSSPQVKEIASRLIPPKLESIIGDYNWCLLFKEYWKLQKCDLTIPARFKAKLIHQEKTELNYFINADEEIKGIAAMLLYMLKAIEPLKQSLTNLDGRIRRESAWALGEIKDFSSKDVLIQACQDSEVEVRQAAKEALVKLIAEFPTLEEPIFLAL
jgi:hypothetical protein